MRCKECGTIIPESEIYTDFYYCHFCKKSMPTGRKQCKADLHLQRERLSEKARKGYDSPNTPTKGSESSRND